MGLRAPRVVLLVPGWDDWHLMARNGIHAMTTMWGGAGWLVVPVVSADVHPALLAALREYDPDSVLIPAARSFVARADMPVLHDAQQVISTACANYRSPIAKSVASAGVHDLWAPYFSTSGPGALTELTDVADTSVGETIGANPALDGALGVCAAAKFGLSDAPTQPAAEVNAHLANRAIFQLLSHSNFVGSLVGVTTRDSAQGDFTTDFDRTTYGLSRVGSTDVSVGRFHGFDWSFLGRGRCRGQVSDLPFACPEGAPRLAGQGWQRPSQRDALAPLTREGCTRRRRGPDLRARMGTQSRCSEIDPRKRHKSRRVFEGGLDDRPPALVVWGDDPADFALAMAWDRTYGHGIWLLDEWWDDGTTRPQVVNAIDSLASTALRRFQCELAFTSTSLSHDQLVDRVQGCDVGGERRLGEPLIRPLDEAMMYPAETIRFSRFHKTWFAIGRSNASQWSTAVHEKAGTVEFAMLPPLPDIRLPALNVIEAKARWHVDITVIGHQNPLHNGAA